MQQHIFGFETLGQNVFSCPVVDLSYYNFEWERFTSVMEPYRFSELITEVKTIKFSLKDQLKRYGYIIEDSTVEWWKKQGSLAVNRLKPHEFDTSLKSGTLEWINDLPVKNKGIIWSRGNNFQNVIADRIIKNIGIETDKFNYWSARDIRTFVDTKFNFNTKTDFCPFTEEAKWATVYNQFEIGHKIAADIMRLQTIARAEADLDIISN